MRSLLTSAIFFYSLLISTQSLSYCQTTSSKVNIYSFPNEIQQLPLSQYARGYNLDFSSQSNFVEIHHPYIASQNKIDIKQGFSLITANGFDGNIGQASKKVMLAQGNDKQSFALWFSQYLSNETPVVENLRYFNIDTANDCYSGLIFSQNLDVIIDCDKKLQTEEISDLICSVSNKDEIKCQSFPTNIKTGTRKSVIYSTKQQTFLFSASLTNNVPQYLQNQTFINVYSVSSESIQKIVTINRQLLKLKTLSISDIDIVNINNVNFILLTDPNQGLIFFTFGSDGKISSQIKVATVFATPRQFDQSPEGNWFVANGQFIVGGNYQVQQNRYLITKFYDVQVNDNIALDLQVSYNLIAIRTSKDQLNIYDRNSTQLRYLLNKQQISKQTGIVLSQYNSKFFLINTTSLFSIQVSNGIIFVKQVTENTDITITANSNGAICNFVISVRQVKDQSVIDQKRTLSDMKIGKKQENRIVLSQYFGGNNLKYSIPSSSKQLDYSFQHVNKLKILPKIQSETLIQSYTLSIDINMYWFIRIFSETMRFDICRKQNTSFKEFQCEQNQQESIQIKNKPYVIASGFQDYRAIFLWSDGESEVFYWKYLGKPLYTIQNISNSLPGARISRIVVGSQFVAILQKQNNRISFVEMRSDTRNFTLTAFTYKDLSQKQLKMIGGYFYPRDIFPTADPHIFYLKLVNSLARIFFNNGKIQILDIKTGKQGLASDKWQAIIGHHTILIATQSSLEQYSIIENKKLHSISSIQLTLPGKFSNLTNTAYFKKNDGSLQLIRLGLSSFDSFYFQIPQNEMNGLDSWDVSGGYLTIGENKVYYQYEKPTLIISASKVNQSTKQNFDISIKVQNDKGQPKMYPKNVTVFTNPTKISKISTKNSTSNGLQLPESAANKSISLSLSNYFDGPISTYSIDCPYCSDKKILLKKPFTMAYNLSQYEGYFAVVKLSDDKVIIGYQDQIKIINYKGEQLASLNVSALHCRSMSISGDNLFAFYHLDQQWIYHIKIHLKPTPQLKLANKYVISQSQLSFYPFEIASYIQKDNTLYIAIQYYLDFDVEDSTANIRIFKLEDKLNQIAVIDSNTFNLDEFETINSMSMFDGKLVFAVGKIGIGYVDLTNVEKKQIFQFRGQQQFNTILDDTQFMRVVIDQTKSNSSSLQVFITTSNSFSFLTTLSISQGEIKSFQLIETYNRYGSQTSMNWALVSSKYIAQAFYNRSIQTQTIVLYKRGSNKNGPIDFFIGHQTSRTASFIPLSAILQDTHPFFLINQDKKSPMILNITDSFELICNYQQPSNFTFITVTAQNAESVSSLQIKVQFDGVKPDDDVNSGAKWYIYLIIAAGVIIVGIVGFVVFKKIKARKENKKVSLFSSKEDINEDI